MAMRAMGRGPAKGDRCLYSLEFRQMAEKGQSPDQHVNEAADTAAQDRDKNGQQPDIRHYRIHSRHYERRGAFRPAADGVMANGWPLAWGDSGAWTDMIAGKILWFVGGGQGLLRLALCRSCAQGLAFAGHGRKQIIP